MLFFLSSLTGLFLFLLYSKYTNNCKMEETLTGQIVVVWCGSRSGEWSSENHGSWNIYLSQKWGTTSGKMKIINVPETVLQYWMTVSGTLIYFYVLLILIYWCEINTINTASSFWLVSASLWCHHSLFLLWWVMEMHGCKVVSYDVIMR